MNFFGHAAVAALHDGASPAFVLGAMLPDFVSISGARSARAVHVETARGVALHHATDELFHASADFVALLTLARERAEAAGLSRGSARAAAHVGVELLLDGLLVEDAHTAELYVAAVALDDHVACKEHDAPRFARFLDRARGYGVPYPYVSPEFVAARVAGALSSRPRLAIDTDGEGALARVLAELRDDVCARRDGLFEGVVDALWKSRGDRRATGWDRG